jgi:hypothetical protein
MRQANRSLRFARNHPPPFAACKHQSEYLLLGNNRMGRNFVFFFSRQSASPHGTFYAF